MCVYKLVVIFWFEIDKVVFFIFIVRKLYY